MENPPHEDPPQRKPWPLKWIVLAILLYVALFNLYLFLTSR